MRLFRKKPKGIVSKGSDSFISPKIQHKLNVGKSGDKYEKEADHIADKIVNKTDTAGSIQKKGTEDEEVQQKPIAESISTVQREAMPEEEQPAQKKAEEEEKPVQKQEQEEEQPVQQKGKEEEEQTVQKQAEEEEKPIQAKLNEQNTGSIGNENIENELANSNGQGNPMDAGTLAEMETGFGSDFSNVNIHTDSKAEQMSQKLGAQAFTHGNDIYFNKGKYNPKSKEGKHLLAHELTHTVQQGKKGTTVKNIQKEEGDVNTVPFKGSFSNQLNVAFFSTDEAPNIEVTLYHKANIHGHQSCASFDLSIDGVARTKRTVETGDNEQKSTFTFKMKNAVKHHLIFNMPTDCKGLSIDVRGTIRRY